MNSDLFKFTDYYFKQSLKLIVYAYFQLKKDRQATPYSRSYIHETIKRKRNNNKSRFQLEDYLRDDLVKNYLKRLWQRFNLELFSVQSGVEEFNQSVRTGIVDIKIESMHCNSLLDDVYFIFECKRIDKYAKTHDAYIDKGMMRFIDRQYYPEEEISPAGMIAFMEVDLKKTPNGYLEIEQVAELLRRRIDDEKNILNVQQAFSHFQIFDDNFPEISSFSTSYLSKHLCNKGGREISIFHLLLDYHELLTP